MNLELIPNKSVASFIIGDIIDSYLYLPHTVEYHQEKSFSYVSYDFFMENIIIWTTGNKIETIRCDVNCFWKGQNLINMFYDDFIILSGQQPDGEDVCYVPISPNRGQNQKVYDFDELGLQLWIWRKKIKTILVSSYSKN